ncbi:MAG: 6-phosphofructokinase [Ruminococcus sp.]|jgi:6-phosphofructokinase 1|nr:6-phosphofructokinase [Ruminococcus sp.]
MDRIGVLTSGGDAPGMNACIRAVTRAAIAKGYEVVGFLKGYNGLLYNKYMSLSARDVSDIIHCGGTILGTARCLEFKEWDNVVKGKENCDSLFLKGLVVIGGDGSFRGALDLTKAGLPCIGVPGTIDNDIACTDYTIGYDTAMNTAMEMADKLRDTIQSHDRCSVVEVMGNKAGWIALNVGTAVGAMAIITMERDFNLDEIVGKMKAMQATGKHHFMVVVSEGVCNIEGITADEIAAKLAETTGVEARATNLGHVQRGGNPTLRDRVSATQMGYHAVNLLDDGISRRVVGERGGFVIDYDIEEALKMTKPFDMNLYHIADEISL